MGHPAHDELVLQVVEPVQILPDEAELAHQLRIFEILFEVGVKLGHKQRISGRQGGNELGINGEVVLGRVTCPASPAVPVERLVKEDLFPLGDKIDRGR